MNLFNLHLIITVYLSNLKHLCRNVAKNALTQFKCDLVSNTITTRKAKNKKDVLLIYYLKRRGMMRYSWMRYGDGKDMLR
jgi:hypothetical protein